jgi:hypothetical protein
MKPTLATFALLAFGAATQAAWGADQAELSLGLGVHYSTGEYGTSSTTRILSIPFTAQYDVGRWQAKLIVPYIGVTGPGNVIPSVGRTSNNNPKGRGGSGAGTSEETASGLGDIVTALTYTAYFDPAAQLGLDVTGKVKFGTADADRGLGTGENDYFLQTDAYKTVERVTGFGGVGRAFLGSSSFIQLKDVWYANAGASYALDSRDSAGLRFDARQAASPGSGAQRELMAFFARKLDKATKAQAYVLFGLAEGSPDLGVGLSLLQSF